VYDCFPYFNEREILELRIRLLQDHVQGMIITDANRTHNGEPKNFTCKHTLQELGVNCSHVHVIEVDLPEGAGGHFNWMRERAQRDAAAELFEDRAVYMVSDCDEIMHPSFVQMFAQAALESPSCIFRPNLAWLNARADLRVCDPQGKPASFLLPFMCLKSHTLNHTLSNLREDQACELFSLPYQNRYLMDHMQNPVDSGWHFSWMGGRDLMKIKMNSYAHSGDPQLGIFSTAVGSVNGAHMREYIDGYKPQPGSHDPYGRHDYFLQHYPEHLLPSMLMQSAHLHPYFFGDFD
jgi:beta-1,4-mannosyl-glycoprotein beta-1,4-N-acetylglucosaminyltransferase